MVDDNLRMLVQSFDSIEIDVVRRFKSLWVTNALDGSEDYLVSERVMLLVGDQMKKFRQNLNSNKGPKSLQDLLKLITPPKGVKRRSQNTAIPIDEGEELFDCDGDELNDEPQVKTDDSDSEGEANEAEQAENANVENASWRHDANSQETVSPVPIYLGNLCEENSDIKKDAVFVDNLGKILSNAETSDKFLPFINIFKRSYIAAR